LKHENRNSCAGLVWASAHRPHSRSGSDTVPLPVESPVSVDIAATPVVTFGTRTIDFTPNLSQEFIAFLPFVTEVNPGTFRNTIGVRARDGLSEFTGLFPTSPDPGFVNEVPLFAVGTTNLLVFDVIVPGWGRSYSVSVVDRNGDPHRADFSNPVPEPTSVLLVGSGAMLLAGVRHRARRRRS
jgi:hypothetical protein